MSGASYCINSIKHVLDLYHYVIVCYTVQTNDALGSSYNWIYFVLQTNDAQESVSRSSCALLKLDFLTNTMHLVYALVRKSSFSKAQCFVKPAPGQQL